MYHAILKHAAKNRLRLLVNGVNRVDEFKFLAQRALENDDVVKVVASPERQSIIIYGSEMNRRIDDIGRTMQLNISVDANNFVEEKISLKPFLSIVYMVLGVRQLFNGKSLPASLPLFERAIGFIDRDTSEVINRTSE